MIKQISVFVQNLPGRLADVTEVLANANVNLSAFTIAETTDFGIFRMIVDKTDEAVKAFEDAGMAVNVTNVLGLQLADEPGSFAHVVKILTRHEINIEYMYAFHTGEGRTAFIIIRVSDNAKAVDVLTNHGVKLITEKDI